MLLDSCRMRRNEDVKRLTGADLPRGVAGNNGNAQYITHRDIPLQEANLESTCAC